MSAFVSHRWTADDDASLSHSMHAGIPTSEIADRMGRTPTSVRHRARILGLYAATGRGLAPSAPQSPGEYDRPGPLVSVTGPRPWKSTDDKALLALHDAGLSPKEIGVKIGRTHGSVLSRRKTLLSLRSANVPVQEGIQRSTGAGGGPWSMVPGHAISWGAIWPDEPVPAYPASWRLGDPAHIAIGVR